MILKDHALILRVYPYSETSLILTCLAARHGRMQVLAKGARRPKNPFLGNLDFLHHGEMIVSTRARSGLDILREFDLTDDFAALRRPVERFLASAFVAEAALNFSVEGAGGERVFAHVIGALRAMAGDGDLRSVLLVFSMGFLDLHGFSPRLDACTGCQKPDTVEFFSHRLGGVLCRACRGRDPASTPLGRESHDLMESFRLREPETGNWKLETGNRELETGNRKPETGNRRDGAYVHAWSALSGMMAAITGRDWATREEVGRIFKPSARR
ncbi:MAG: DNA repair protein RecO [Planctomycetota bacterium]